eukprot:Plantae.Rhodophyta-Hildenbrandia_rubra.ctg5779.p1 GENE.Plantae.Rhodophyta-Hildenbrandia_rubra.ctg5779~~Plantae.Rhodophyta-Hildenbrandia_rubra.ctg5779.p1  ORF type:complete len:457 (+),score=94.52 Plantae.Rhodophyta-Hildenbrandia_rubra.ctg5779:403-1773(+)
MDGDEQVVPGVPLACERVVPLSTAHIKTGVQGVPTKNGGGLRRVPSVTGSMAGYGVVVGNGGGGLNGMVAPGMMGMGGMGIPGSFGMVGLPYGYAAGVPAGYGGGAYGYGCQPQPNLGMHNAALVGMGVPGFVGGQQQSQVKKVKIVEKLPEVTSGCKGKPRWSTPRRRGSWKEKWNCAKDWGAHSSVSHVNVKEMCEVVRCAVSEEISKRCKDLGVGCATVEKWMCLLAEYLELNGDEHILLAVLISRYGKGDRGWTGENDWCRPQRWECVVALAAYMAVLLSEEFPGKVAQDLQELLGRNFQFGKEQLAFLLAIDWRVNIGEPEFQQVQNLVGNAAKEIKGKSGPERMAGPHFKQFVEWFVGQRTETSVNKPVTPKVTTNVPIAPKVAMSPITPDTDLNTGFLGKKRTRDMITPSEDDALSVPDAKRKATMRNTEYSTSYQQVGVVPSMDDWAY